MPLPDWSGLAKWAETQGYQGLLDTAHFARLLGIAVEDFPPICLEAIRAADFRYQTVAGPQRDEVLLRVMERLDSGQLSLAGEASKARWDTGWNENYQALIKTDDVAQLTPKYIHPGRPLRLDGSYVVSRDPNFELNWYEVFRDWLFTTYLGPFPRVIEFACGPCHNVAALARQFPDKELTALDWAEPSVKIAERLRELHGWNLHGRHFDFFHPDAGFRIKPDSAVLTIGGLEQVGNRFLPFYEYLRASEPGLVIHVEPFVEWYEPANLTDYLAVRHHRLRHYLEGYIPHLLAEARQGSIEIIRAQCIRFGSLFHDGYSVMVWRPRQGAPVRP